MSEVTVTVLGTVCSEVRYTTQGESGIPVARFQLRSLPRRYDRRSGTWTDGEPSYYSITCWRHLAEHAASSLGVGDPVVATGRLRISRWKRYEESMISAEIDAQSVGHDLRWGTSVYRMTAPKPSRRLPAPRRTVETAPIAVPTAAPTAASTLTAPPTAAVATAVLALDARPTGPLSDARLTGSPSGGRLTGSPSDARPTGSPSDARPTGSPSDGHPTGPPLDARPTGYPPPDVLPVGLSPDALPAGSSPDVLPAGPPPDTLQASAPVSSHLPAAQTPPEAPQPPASPPIPDHEETPMAA